MALRWRVSQCTLMRLQRKGKGGAQEQSTASTTASQPQGEKGKKNGAQRPRPKETDANRRSALLRMWDATERTRVHRLDPIDFAYNQAQVSSAGSRLLTRPLPLSLLRSLQAWWAAFWRSKMRLPAVVGVVLALLVVMRTREEMYAEKRDRIVAPTVRGAVAGEA